MKAPPCPLFNTRDISFFWEGAGRSARAIDVYQTRDKTAWEKVLRLEPDRKKITVQVLEDGWYGFTLVAVGPDGEEEPGPESGDDPEIQAMVDTQGPEIQAFGPPSGTFWEVEQPMPLSWQASDASGVREILIEYLPEGKDDWRPAHRAGAPKGEKTWAVPRLLSSGFQLRLVAVDQAGNRSEPKVLSFRVKTPPVSVPVVLRGPASTRERTVRLEAQLADADWERVDHLELWQTEDNGRTWKRRAEAFRKDAREISVRLEETGRYGFFVRPVAPGEPTLESLRAGVLAQLECWAAFPHPEVKVERQSPPSEEARSQARKQYLAAQASLARGSAGDARRSLETTLEIWPEFAPALNDLACMDIQEKRLEAARELLLKAVELFPEDADYRFNLGVCLMAQGKSLEALEHLEKSSQNARRRTEAQLALADCLASLGDLDRALAICRSISGQEGPVPLVEQARKKIALWEARQKGKK